MSIQNHNPFYKLLEGESQKLLDTRYKDFIGVKSDLERIDFKQNEKFFKNLTRKLEKKKLNNVILLQPECCNNLKTLMRFVSDTFLDNASERQLKEEEEHEKTNHVTYMDIDTDETNPSKDENDFNTMMLWYKSIYQPENFVNQGAENFRKLPYSVKRLLKLEHFEMPDQLTIFDEFISDLCDKTFQTLYKTNYEIRYSISSFITSYKKPGLGKNEYTNLLLNKMKKLGPASIESFLTSLITNLTQKNLMPNEIKKLKNYSQKLKSIEKRRTRPIRKEISNSKYNPITQRTDLINDMTNFLERFFEENLQHYTINPLHEIYYHKGDGILKSAFNQTPRQIITAALGLPTCYLDCNCCPVDSSNAIHNNNSLMANNNNNACDVVDDKVKLDPREQILTTQNDICILYKLYLQCGISINIHDWLESFGSLIKKGNENIDDDEIKLRFIKAFKELKLLGIISTAAKKKDHVKRLLWGTY
nr:4709_t:CDS:10 [Entrophospora candida]